MAKSNAVEERKPEAAKTAEAPTCQHHWVIESPRGAVSAGYCKRCGEQREFRNSTDYIWDDDKSGSGYTPWRGIRSTPRVSDDDEMAASAGSGRTALLV